MKSKTVLDEFYDVADVEICLREVVDVAVDFPFEVVDFREKPVTPMSVVRCTKAMESLLCWLCYAYVCVCERKALIEI